MSEEGEEGTMKPTLHWPGPKGITGVLLGPLKPFVFHGWPGKHLHQSSKPPTSPPSQEGKNNSHEL